MIIQAVSSGVSWAITKATGSKVINVLDERDSMVLPTFRGEDTVINRKTILVPKAFQYARYQCVSETVDGCVFGFLLPFISCEFAGYCMDDKHAFTVASSLMVVGAGLGLALGFVKDLRIGSGFTKHPYREVIDGAGAGMVVGAVLGEATSSSKEALITAIACSAVGAAIGAGIMGIRRVFEVLRGGV